MRKDWLWLAYIVSTAAAFVAAPILYWAKIEGWFIPPVIYGFVLLVAGVDWIARGIFPEKRNKKTSYHMLATWFYILIGCMPLAMGFLVGLNKLWDPEPRWMLAGRIIFFVLFIVCSVPFFGRALEHWKERYAKPSKLSSA